MRKTARVKKKIYDYFFDHPTQKRIYNYVVTSFISALCGIIFAFGFSTFISVYKSGGFNLATGGFSGMTQAIALLIVYMNKSMDLAHVQSLLYFAINIPALIFAYFKIGKKFALTTTINVGLSSLFISFFSSMDVVQEISNNEFISSSPLTRVLFAGICTGVSSGIALKFGTSCGGMDIVTCYLSIRRSTGVGKYSIIANCIVVFFYMIANLIVYPNKYVDTILIVPFAVVYFLATALVIDTIHIRNKKIAVEIITQNDYITDVLINLFPHSATIYEAHGAYSGASEHSIKMIISSYESKKVVKIVKKIDANSFITLTPLTQVYGNFFINPIE
ncbi:MAG: YitT family protein [Bacilli bacterium]|nr:YitT family protein [Bacilli bacterium]